MSQITKHIGARVRFYRKNLGLSLDELADAVHKSKSTLSKYEAGSVVLDVDVLFDLAKALNVPVEKLIDYKEHVPGEMAPFTARGFFYRAVNSLKNENFTSGLVAGISSTYLVPTAFKAIFSHTQMEDDEMIRCALQFTKEDNSLIRKNNALLLANVFPALGKRG